MTKDKLLLINKDTEDIDRLRVLLYNPDYTLNKNDKVVQGIAKGLVRCDGECPCDQGDIPQEDKMCHCKQLRENRVCKCGLYQEKEKSPLGEITIKKISNNLGYVFPGGYEYGLTQQFIEGHPLLLSNPNEWFHTSIIKSIDWENNTFKTLNSTYSFNFKPLIKEDDGKDVPKYWGF